MAQQTALMELLQWVRATLPMDLDTPRMIEEKIESLLPKEREQIINAWMVKDNPLQRFSAEKYYEHTYGK